MRSSVSAQRSQGFRVCLAVFAVALAGVYGGGLMLRAPQTNATDAPATAAVAIRAEQTSESPSGLSAPDAAALRGQVLSDENLNWAIGRRLATAPGLAGELIPVRLRPNLADAVMESPDGMGILVSVSFRDPSQRWALPLVTDLAARYAAQCRDGLRDEVRARHSAATAAAKKSHESTVQAAAALRGFLDEHFRNVNGPADASAVADAAAQALAPGRGRADSPQAVSEYRRLSESLTEALGKEEVALQAERDAATRQFRLPRVELVGAASSGAGAAAGGPWSRFWDLELLGTALAAALGLAIVAWLLSVKTSPEPVLASVATAIRELPVPVLGVIVEPHLADETARAGR